MPITSPSGRKNENVISSQISALSHNFRSEKRAVTITLNHFSAAAVFALFASIVFGITHRETTRDMVRYGLYCFAMFLGGVLVAGWAMWLLRR
jgi:vacuolar-type H+-ATPase catalytic subunit A/Vma1